LTLLIVVASAIALGGLVFGFLEGGIGVMLFGSVLGLLVCWGGMAYLSEKFPGQVGVNPGPPRSYRTTDGVFESATKKLGGEKVGLEFR
jgi:hypothetical protein